MKRINIYISDLFFNTDISSAVNHDEDGAAYDAAALLSEAESFLACLEGLGVHAPTADELVADFQRRL